MRPRELTAIFFCAWTLVAVLPAQTPPASAPPPVPPGPLIAKTAPDFAQWTATTKSTANNPGGAATSKKADASQSTVQVVKTGDIRHVIIARGNGSRMENWCEGDLQVVTCPEWPLPVLSSGEQTEVADRIDFSHGDFAGFDWISAKNFVGIQKVGGSDCLTFQQTIYMEAALPMGRTFKVNHNLRADGADKGPVAPATAYIDLKTRLPVSIQCGDELTTFTFDRPPTEKLSLPPELQAVIDNWLALKKQITHVPVHP